jgi:ArsR family transcriptional regulator
MKRNLALQPRDPVNLERARRRLTGASANRAMQRLRKALCDPARLQIVEALTTAELCVSDLALAIDRAPAATSQHLRVLRDLDFVDSARKGTTVYYRLKSSASAQLNGVLNSLAGRPPPSTV